MGKGEHKKEEKNGEKTVAVNVLKAKRNSKGTTLKTHKCAVPTMMPVSQRP